MTHSGRCYCGKINYEFEEPIYTQILCHCRECRYISGGEANASIVISENNKKINEYNEEKIVNKIKKYLKKYSLKDTVNLILETEKINKKKVYDLCLKTKNEKNN